MLDDGELSDLLDVAVARFVDPPPMPMVPDGVVVHQVEASLVSRDGWVLGIVVRHATPLATAWRWYRGSASGVALSEADTVARVAAKRTDPGTTTRYTARPTDARMGRRGGQ
jgi:hypothetical protein